MTSAYDYAVSEILGFHVDFEKTLKQQYEEIKQKNQVIKLPTENQLDSLMEKIDKSVDAMHRPIVFSKSAGSAELTYTYGQKEKRNPIRFTKSTFEYIRYTEESKKPLQMRGRISSYNVNTFKGRIFLFDQQRPIPFELADNAKSQNHIKLITTSLAANALDPSGGVELVVIALSSTSRLLKNRSRGRL